jgi:hypothetical protein
MCICDKDLLGKLISNAEEERMRRDTQRAVSSPLLCVSLRTLSSSAFKLQWLLTAEFDSRRDEIVA